VWPSRALRPFFAGAAMALIPLTAIPFAFGMIEYENDYIRFGSYEIFFNSRSLLWSFGFEYAAERPWFGYGNGGFWNDERLSTFVGRYGWTLDNFHNGYVTLLTEFGAVGLDMFAILMLLVFRRNIVELNHANGMLQGIVAFRLSYFTMFVVMNSVENFATRSTNLFTFLFIAFLIYSFASLPVYQHNTTYRNSLS
jgi:O-antigen ligase